MPADSIRIAGLRPARPFLLCAILVLCAPLMVHAQLRGLGKTFARFFGGRMQESAEITSTLSSEDASLPEQSLSTGADDPDQVPVLLPPATRESPPPQLSVEPAPGAAEKSATTPPPPVRLPPVPPPAEEIGPGFDTRVPPINPHFPTPGAWPCRWPEPSTVVLPATARTTPMMPYTDERVSLVVRETSIGTVLTMIAEQHRLNVITSGQVSGTISLALENVPLPKALDAILTANGYTWNLLEDLLVVSRLASDARLSPFAQGRQVRVFDLNYTAASDVDQVVTGLLSPVGQSFIVEASPSDKRRTREQLIVEDLPVYLDRVAAYVEQCDHPPRQVLIEAHILEVTLRDDTSHGVDINALSRVSGADLTIDSEGFADDKNSPAFFFRIDGTDLNSLVDLIKTTTEAKTLAAPKVLTVNGQESRIQIGSQFGYFVTTTTETSTLQSVEFLEVGVVLRVTPLISSDGRVLMTIMPEVSGGRINPATGLPEEDTTEVQTTVMLGDGEAMVIGGLIQEEDTEVQNKVPYLGDLWKIGRLFQHRNVVRERHEIIVALVPHVLPYGGHLQCRQQEELSRAYSPVTVGPLLRADRRIWVPDLPDAVRNPINR